MKKKLSYALNIVLMVAILLVTFYVLQREQNMGEIFQELKKVDKLSIFFAVLASVLFLVLQGISLQIILASLGAPVRLISSVGYSFIGFLYNAITPSASGGQPMQVLYMHKDGIPIGASSVSLLFWTILYKMALLIIQLYALLFHYSFLREHLGEYDWLYLVGLLVNLVSVALYSIVVFSRKGVASAANMVAWLCHKLHIVKRREKIQKRLDTMVGHYQEGADYMRTHWKVTVVILLITIVQRLFYFSVTWFVYKSFGLEEYSIIEILILQSLVSVCIDILPMPGGVGLNEGFFVTVFRKIMGRQMAFSAMLLSRGASFYALLVVSVFVTIGVQIRGIHKAHRRS